MLNAEEVVDTTEEEEDMYNWHYPLAYPNCY